jgi:hypothetical protein
MRRGRKIAKSSKKSEVRLTVRVKGKNKTAHDRLGENMTKLNNEEMERKLK